MNLESGKFATDYLATYSNDWRGWKQLAVSHMRMSFYEQAILAYTNAIRFGDQEDYLPLGLAALDAQRLDVFRNQVAPSLLKLKDSADSSNRLQIVEVLIIYALADIREDVFVKALRGVTSAEIMARGTESIKAVLTGWNAWDPSEVRPLCEELERAADTKPKQPKTSNKGS
jgi:hypothetical protein